MFVYNHDVDGLQRRINRFIEEMIKAASNTVSQVNAFDQTRLASYINAIREYQAFINGQPQLDLPETNPREFELGANPVVPDLENESLRDVVVLLELARDEIINGQSARMPSGLIPYDSARLTAIVDKVDSLLTNYISIVTPLDLPESSPMREITGPGRKGV